MLCLLDSDIFAYRAARAAETEQDFGNDIWSLHMDMNDAKDAYTTMIKNVTDTLGIKDTLHCFSDHTGNFRKQVCDTYKSGRRGTRKPVGFVALCDWIKSTNKSLTKTFLEADDVLGIMQTRPDMVGKTVIVSDDKDLRGIPGKLYRPLADEQLEISESEADRFFLTQVLTGDQADSYAGVPGIGPKKAETVLGSRPSWGAVEQAFIKAGLTKEDAITQARLARILRWSDWDAAEGRPRLWNP